MISTTATAAPRRELLRALGALAEHPTDAVARAVDIAGPLDPADHTEVFTFHALPYASAYLGADGMLGGEAAARVAGFWQAVGYEPPPSPDHLAALLGLYTGLAEQEISTADAARRALIRRSRHALLWEHLLPWTGILADLVRHSGVSPWGTWADLLQEAIAAETSELAESPLRIPRHLHEAPPPLTTGFEAADLLVPIKTGMIVTRLDLARTARELGLGLRLTGRLPTLRAFLRQSRPETLHWLADHARRWERQHRNRAGPAVIDDFWAGRAATTAATLDLARSGAPG